MSYLQDPSFIFFWFLIKTCRKQLSHNKHVVPYRQNMFFYPFHIIIITKEKEKKNNIIKNNTLYLITIRWTQVTLNKTIYLQIVVIMPFYNTLSSETIQFRSLLHKESFETLFYPIEMREIWHHFPINNHCASDIYSFFYFTNNKKKWRKHHVKDNQVMQMCCHSWEIWQYNLFYL